MEIPLLSLGHLVLGIVLSLHVLWRKERPVSAVLWLAVVWTFPFLGALAYLSFGVDRVPRRAAERRAARLLMARRLGELPSLEALAVDAGREGRAAHIFRATDPAVPENPVLRGNRARLLVDGDEFYPALERAIAEARHTVHLQTFIFARDGVGRRFRDLLSERARQGVEVRVLYDRFGSTFSHFTLFFERAVRAGVRVRSISQANPLKGRFQVNLRNHRKLAVVDGRIGFLGGINLADRNLSRPDRPADRDYQVELRGPAVADLQRQFLEDWHFASGDPPEDLLDSRLFPPLEPVGDGLVQIVPGGPERGGRRLAEAFFGAIVAAERSLTVVTPYFIPDEPIVQALRYTALRGVEVRLVVPEKSNHWYTGFAARSLYAPLLEAGVSIFERGPPFMHAKALLADGVYAMLGSANLDYRSLYLNFELNVEIADPAFIAEVAAQVEEEIAAGRQITREAHRARSVPRRLLENACRLFQPIL